MADSQNDVNHDDKRAMSVQDYADIVKTILKDDVERYRTFLKVMQDVNFYNKFYGRLANVWLVAPIAIRRVKALFKGHPQHLQLLSGFTAFLPRGYEFALSNLEEDKHPPEVCLLEGYQYDKAMRFVNKVIALSVTEQPLYKAFMASSNSFRPGMKGALSAFEQKVARLFVRHEDLLEGFTQWYMPCLPRDAHDVGGLDGSACDGK